MIQASGFTPAQVRSAVRAAEIYALGAEDDLLAEIMRRYEPSQNAAARAVLRRWRQPK
jgi:hypothetical protein